jgi:hypothetical protein
MPGFCSIKLSTMPGVGRPSGPARLEDSQNAVLLRGDAILMKQARTASPQISRDTQDADGCLPLT